MIVKEIGRFIQPEKSYFGRCLWKYDFPWENKSSYLRYYHAINVQRINLFQSFLQKLL